MSFKDNQDLRVRGQGGWAYAEHELWSVFAPLIGPAGVSVYMALCRLVPLAGINSDRPVTVRAVSEASCVGRSKAAELLQTIFKLGMVIQTKYLDGRDPSYKLSSLHELAKVGQKELLARFGVHAADTGPYDQGAKHRRERAARVQETQAERAEEQQTKPLPLLDEADTAEGEGVHVADTHQQKAADEAGVHVVDTVSTKSPFVSTETAFVSTKSGLVSAPVDTFKEEKRSEDFKDLTPLPPAELGDVEDENSGEPVLPSARPTIADPAFKTSLPFAVRWVMAELGITKRRLEDVIAQQLTLWCRQHRDEPLENAATLMARQGKELHANAQMLRHNPWGWPKFFGEGHWSRPLPYASPSAEREAIAGMRPAGSEDVSPDMLQRAVPWIEANAAVLGDHDLEQFAVRLRAAAKLDVGLDELDRTLQAIEDELCEYLVSSADREDLAKIRREVDEQIQPHTTRMTREQIARMRQNVLPKRVLTAAGLPRLSIFYMPHR